MSQHFSTIFLFALVTAASTQTTFAQHQMPAGMTHEGHLAQMKKEAELKARGAVAMGFDQDAAEHHFLLFEDGGAIDVQAVRNDDTATRDLVRTHLQEVAREFASGNFEKPFATHAETPDGVPELRGLKGVITYVYEATPRGGRVRISSSDAGAVAAIHEFIRYQIVEHKTGDPLTLRKQ
jgi:hypothetical protein